MLMPFRTKTGCEAEEAPVRLLMLIFSWKDKFTFWILIAGTSSLWRCFPWLPFALPLLPWLLLPSGATVTRICGRTRGAEEADFTGGSKRA